MRHQLVKVSPRAIALTANALLGSGALDCFAQGTTYPYCGHLLRRSPAIYQPMQRVGLSAPKVLGLASTSFRSAIILRAVREPMTIY
jgi:hypothetical protein